MLGWILEGGEWKADFATQKLYHQTLAIRPKLIKLIEKYSQKKGMTFQEGVRMGIG